MNIILSRLASFVLAPLLLLAASELNAEQKQRLGPYDVHYAVVQSTFFGEEIARRYQIVRGIDRALLNISILDAESTPVPVSISGNVTNLLGQSSQLEFREVREQPAIYYLAQLKYADRETLRFRIRITTPDGMERELAFQQQMFVDDR